MKMLFKFLITSVIVSVALSGCSKKNEKGTQPLTATNWSIGANSYKGTSTVFTNGDLIAVDNAVSTYPNISVQFAGTPAAGTYTVVNNLTYGGNLSSSQCFIDISDGNGDYEYYSDNGGTATVSVSGGKITVTFSNIAMGNQNGFDTAGNPIFVSVGATSGTLIQQ